MAQALVLIGGAIFVALGAVHGLLTLRDVFVPKSFTPTDPGVRSAMQEARLAFNPRVDIWNAWLGFNLSHSLGLALFGGVVLVVGGFDFALFASQLGVQAATVLVAAAYFVLAVRFWFWGPALGSGSALLCFLAAMFLCWSSSTA